MKTKIITALVFFFMTNGFSNAQVVIKVKPIKPKVVVVKTKRPSAKHLWVEGYWKWNQNHKKYVWTKGAWVKARRGKVWIAGHWTKRPKGYVWTEGYWRKRVA